MQKRNIFYYLKKKNIYKKRRPNFCSPYKEIPPLKNLSIWNQIIQKRRNNWWTKLQLSIPRWVLLSIFLKVFVMMNNWYDVKNTTYIWRWVNLKYTPKNWTKILSGQIVDILKYLSTTQILREIRYGRIWPQKKLILILFEASRLWNRLNFSSWKLQKFYKSKFLAPKKS